MSDMKLPRWKQKTPFDQLTAIRNGFEGNVINFEDDIISKEQMIQRALEFSKELEALQHYLQNPDQW
jgi:hypothetical protein